MLTKVLLSCALLVAAQAGHAPSNYGSNNAKISGYRAQYEPALTLTVLPSYGNSYGAAPSNSPAYDYTGKQNVGAYQAPISIPYYSSQPAHYRDVGVNNEALQLANIALGLPSAGSPLPVNMYIPNYSNTGYTAPAGNYGTSVNGASAAVAASNTAAELASSYKNSPY